MPCSHTLDLFLICCQTGGRVSFREIDASQLSLYGSPKRQKLLTDSDSDTMTHFTVSQRSSVDGIDRRVRKDYEDSADDGEVVLSGTTAEQPSDLVTYEEQVCIISCIRFRRRRR